MKHSSELMAAKSSQEQIEATFREPSCLALLYALADDTESNDLLARFVGNMALCILGQITIADHERLTEDRTGLTEEENDAGT